MEKIKLLLVFFVSALIASSPCYAQEWAKTYGGNGSDGLLTSMQQTSDGGCIFGVHSSSFTGDFSDGYNTWIFKVDSDGNITWEKKYVGYRSYPDHIIQTADGGYIAVGVYVDDGGGWGSLWVLKLNSDGTIDWQKLYGQSCTDGSNFGMYIQEAIDPGGNPDGYVVLAKASCYGPGLSAVWVLRLNADGTIAWQKGYGGYDEDFGSSILQTADGGFVVAGGTLSLGPNIVDMWVLKLNSDGTVDWEKTYGGRTATEIRETRNQQGNPDGYILAGTTTNFGAGGFDVMILKLNPDGTIVWQKTYGGSYDDDAYDIEQTSDGGYVVAGRSSSFGLNYSAWIFKLDSSGNVVWERTYDGDDWDFAYSIEQTSDGGYIVAGETQSFGAGSRDVFMLKLNANGEIPGCSIMGTSQAVVTDTSVSDIDSNATILNTSVVPIDTYLIDQDTSAETSDQCAQPAPPVAAFTANVTSGTVPLIVQFTDQSTGTVTSWSWDFGDSETSNEQNPSHEYQSAGDFTVSLTVTGPGGPDTESKTDYIHVEPLPEPTISHVYPRQQEPTLPPSFIPYVNTLLGYPPGDGTDIETGRYGLIRLTGNNFGASQSGGNVGDMVKIGTLAAYRNNVPPTQIDLTTGNPGTGDPGATGYGTGIPIRIKSWNNDYVGVYLLPVPGHVLPTLYHIPPAYSWLETWKLVWVVKDNGDDRTGLIEAAVSNPKALWLKTPLPDPSYHVFNRLCHESNRHSGSV